VGETAKLGNAPHLIFTEVFFISCGYEFIIANSLTTKSSLESFLMQTIHWLYFLLANVSRAKDGTDGMPLNLTVQQPVRYSLIG